MLDTLKKHALRVLNVCLIAAVALLVIDVLLGVASRYLWGAQIKWTEELATVLLVWVSFLGIAACLTPLKTELPFGLRTESVEAASVRGVMAVTRGVNFFSGQSGRNTACRERLGELLASADAAAVELKAKRAQYEAMKNGEPLPPPPPAEEKPGMLQNVKEQKEQRDQEMNK